jgi:hypothetical protein
VDAAGPFTATPKQLEFAKQFYTDGVKTVLFGGAIRSGKTQAAAMLLVATAVKTQGTYLVSRLTYRELKDTTQKAMLYGDGALPPLIAPNLISQ